MTAKDLKLRDLKETRAAYNGKLSMAILRAAVRRGELTAYRTTDSCSARILLDADEVAYWLRTKCAGRNVVPSPAEVARLNAEADAAEGDAR